MKSALQRKWERESPLDETQIPRPIAIQYVLVPIMLLASSAIMALAWLGHLRFAELPIGAAIFCAWLLVLPEYFFNILALRMGVKFYTGGQMAAFRLSSGVICVALVSHYILDERLNMQKMLGFGLMLCALLMITLGKHERVFEKKV